MRKIITAFTLGAVACGCGSESGTGKEHPQIEVLVDTGTRTKTVVADVVGDNVITEGDILLGKTHEIEPEKPLSVNLKDLDTRWPYAKVHYSYEAGLPASQQAAFEGAIDTIEAMTSITFEYVATPLCPLPSDPTIVVKDAGEESNSSKVGMKGGCQDLFLNDDAGPGAARHELGHALGLPHEQSRPDRDQYVEICWDNIIPGKEDNFAKKDANEVDVLSDYEFGSVMHYGRMNQSLNSLDEGDFFPDFPAMRMWSDPFDCDEEVTSGVPSMSGNGNYTSEDLNALLLMYAKPLDIPESLDSMGGAMAMGFLDGCSSCMNGVTGDGWRDLVIGAPKENIGIVPYEGAVFVFKGTKKHPAPWKRLRASPSPGTKALFGAAIAIGDFDGDGDGDLAIGAPAATHDGVSGGAVYIFRLDAGAFTQVHRLQAKHTSSASPDVAGDRFGVALAAQDFDNDGRAELLIGAPGRGGRGRVHVFNGTAFFGSSQPTATQVLDQPSPQFPGADFGAAIAIGDVTPTTPLDVIIGAPKGGTTGSGAVHVFKAPPGAISHYLRVEQVLGSSGGDQFGASIAVATMGAPTQTLLVGAPNKLKTQTNTRTGAVFSFDHSTVANRFDALTAAFPGGADVQRFGHALAAVALGGVTESIVITAPRFGGGEGRAVIMKRQGTGLTKTHDLTSTGSGSSGFGTSVVTGTLEVAAIPPAQGFPESAQTPRVYIGAPGFAGVGATHAYTIGAVNTYYRHSLTQLSGSMWSEWAP